MRFALDSLLLASFAAQRLKETPPRLKNPRRDGEGMAVADLGCGCGAVSLGLLLLAPDLGINARVLGVDREEELVDAAERNARLLGFDVQAVFSCCDVGERNFPGAPLWDVVVTNPPFWREGEGRPAKSVLGEAARRGDVSLFVTAAARGLVHRGRLFLVYPANLLGRLANVLKAGGFGLRTLLFVRPTRGADATRVLAEAWKGAEDDTRVPADLVLYGADGPTEGKNRPYSDQARSFCPWLQSP